MASTIIMVLNYLRKHCKNTTKYQIPIALKIELEWLDFLTYFLKTLSSLLIFYFSDLKFFNLLTISLNS
jgi:hypothetical protein